ncbi:MAG: cell division protein FtsA [Candidatus Latescibacteria bacterium]|nr:cell division protein FtsA [Candidatus Latescibacterota bacterium]
MAQGGIVVGLDLGTAKFCAVIAERDQAGTAEIIGVGVHPSEGLQRGVVVDVERAVQAIGKAVEEASLMAGVHVGAVYAGIAGEHLHGFDSHGLIAVGGVDQEISAAEKERVIETAQTVAQVDSSREILHVLPQEFAVDEQRGIRDPVGINGVRLEVAIHLVTGSVTAAQNICKSILRAGIEVKDIVFEPLAASYAVLEEEERELGVCLLDIGAGTTGLAVFKQNSVRHTAVLGLGGQNATNDLAVGLRTSVRHAERLKKEKGCVLEELVLEDDEIEVPGIGSLAPHRAQRHHLATVLGPRMEEILTLVRDELERVGWNRKLDAGIVLTGGGSMLEGMVELAEQVFRLPVRLGQPQGLPGLTEKVSSPEYATAVGLVLYGAADQAAAQGEVQLQVSAAQGGGLGTVVNRVRDWFDTLV